MAWNSKRGCLHSKPQSQEMVHESYPTSFSPSVSEGLEGCRVRIGGMRDALGKEPACLQGSTPTASTLGTNRGPGTLWDQNRFLPGLAAQAALGFSAGIPKGSQALKKPKGEATGMPLEALILPLSLQVTQLQQVYADRRQRLHRTVAPAVPVCGKERGGRPKGGGRKKEGLGGLRGS